MQRSLVILILCLLDFISAKSAVKMECASVAASGAVTISWSNTATAANFHAYYIYHSTSVAGSYTLIDSVLVYATQTYTDINANATATGAVYFVTATLNTGASTTGDTISAIFLNVINPNNGFATLFWNTTETPLIATNSIYYKIFREYPVGVWTLIDSVDATAHAPNYSDQVAVCNDTLKYRIEVSDASGCTSVSNVTGDLFHDLRTPNVPVVDSVTVDATGNAFIGWQIDSSTDAQAYVILQLIGTTWTIIDTVYGRANTSLLTNVDVSSSSQQFCLLAVDNCFNRSAYGIAHNTILLDGVLNKCNATYSLSWNAYINWSGAVSYEIWQSENSGAFILAGTTSATSFDADSLMPDSLYCFFVRAIETGTSRTSTSTEVCITPDLPRAPLFSYINKVSVLGSNAVYLEAYVDTNADVKEYHVLRSDSPNGNFSLAGIIPDINVPNIFFIDNNASPEEGSNYFKLASIDSCGKDAFPSNIARTIFVEAKANDDYTNGIGWNGYQSWLGEVYNYDLIRIVDGVALSNSLYFFTSFDTVFTDIINHLYYTQGNFCYYVVAHEGYLNPYGFRDTSVSNTVCIVQEPEVFIPNAFHPDGLNNIFNPAQSFISLEEYSLDIYNRWGENVFHSDSPGIGWDGRSKSGDSPMGVYMYVLNARGGENADKHFTEIKKQGRVTLIR